MPYLNDTDRDQVESGPAFSAGQLTYQFTIAIQDHLALQLDECGRLRYEDLARVLGALEGAKADFIHRILIPYEERARERNEDVWFKRILLAVGGQLFSQRPIISDRKRRRKEQYLRGESLK